MSRTGYGRGVRRRTTNARAPEPASPPAAQPGPALDGVSAEPAPPALIEAVDVTVVHELRARGFTGELPHLTRRGPDRVDLIGIHLSGEGVHIVAASHHPGEHLRPDATRVPDDIDDETHRLSLLVDGRAPAGHAARSGAPDDLNARRRWQAFWPDAHARGPRPHEALPFRHPSVVASEAWTLIQQRVMPFWEGGPHRGH